MSVAPATTPGAVPALRLVLDEADDWGEPTTAELEEIEAEWPVIAAELAVVDAECRFVASPDATTRRHLRRAVAARDRALTASRRTTDLRNRS